MDAYADFTFYTDDFHGTAISEADFPALSLQATIQINNITFNRAVDEEDVDNIELIKLAMCAVAEELQMQSQNDNADGISSESVGRYSVSYATNSNKMKTNTQKIQDVAKIYLGNTGLMFAGFYSGELGGHH